MGEPERRGEVLETALNLISEHGVRGASLRMLAKELGMSQPSLYHYFPSKDALIEAIVAHCTEQMTAAAGPLPKSLLELPRLARDATLALWTGSAHPRFVRFLFAVAIEGKEHAPLVRRIFEERLYPSFSLLAAAYSADEAARERLRRVMQMVVYSFGFMLLEQRAILGADEPSADVLAYGEWAIVAAEELLRAIPSAESGA